MTLAPTRIPVADWSDALADARARGLTYFSHLAAVDRIDAVEIVVHLSAPDASEQVLLSTSVPVDSAVVPSAVPVFPGADWHEREAAEMLGITFTGHPDPRPLLLREVPDTPPLRRGTPLPARLEADWPGAHEPESSTRRSTRRPARPPGVHEEWRVDPASWTDASRDQEPP